MTLRETKFVDVILPLSLQNTYTYRVPVELNDKVQKGLRVVVQFGPRKLYAALINKVHEKAPVQYEAKYIHSILDTEPVVTDSQLKLWNWMSEYYMSPIGEVMKAALPSGFKLTSETKITIEELPADMSTLSDKEFLIIQALEIQQVLTVLEAEEILGQKIVYPVLKSLLDKRNIVIQEEIKENYKPLTAFYIRLGDKLNDNQVLSEFLDTLGKKTGKQLDVVVAYLKLRANAENAALSGWVKKADLMQLVSAAEYSIRALIKKNIFEQQQFEVGRLQANTSGKGIVKKLNASQHEAYGKVINSFNAKDVVLLHGVTSSGKTELYIQLIQEQMQQGKQVLYLVPEIALTTQIISRLQAVFNNELGVYHSRFNENERVEIYNKLLHASNGEPTVILGARSALFLPFSNLGLVIIDEEHDTSFKQFDPAPRYNARDSAMVLARLHHAKVILGSATPSIESYYNAQVEKYGLIALNQRYGNIQMPAIQIVDVRDAIKRKVMKSHFTPQLIDEIKLALDNKEQVILFQNRRGFSPLIECNMCAYTPHCKNCDVSLTYHKSSSQLRCHYCGYVRAVPTKCEACGDTNLKAKGFGTEKIEEDLSVYFPGARVARMDLDTTRKKNSHRQIINEFEQGNCDILVGTQMVTKGLDFDNVALVGILNADSMLNFPDFRSYERSYQMMAQVAGRAGRKKKQGRVIIQTHNPDHPIITYVVQNNFKAMYEHQLEDRKGFNYPPFTRLIDIIVKHRTIEEVNEAARIVADELRKAIGNRVVGPEFPIVARVRNEYLKKMMIKISRDDSVSSVKKQIELVLNNCKPTPEFKGVRFKIDVDPM